MRLTCDNPAVVRDGFFRSEPRQGLYLLRGEDTQLTQDLNRHSRADTVGRFELAPHPGGISV